MERFFTPVRRSSEDEVKIYRHSHHTSHHHQTHSNYCQQPGSQSSSSSHGKHRNKVPNHHHEHHDHSCKPSKAPRERQRSSSSLSSSSSTSWTSEPSLDEEAFLMQKPQHSLSCSNIPEEQRNPHHRNSKDFEFNYQKHRYSLENPNHLLPASQHRRQHIPKLSRGHSKSEEGLQQTKPASKSMDRGPLYKTTSLEQNLGFNNTPGAPKKSVSSIQLPSKGILKNKDEGQKGGYFRKAKSMEVLSTRVQVTASKQTSKEAAKENFVKGKMQFSAFLDEITRQVISPCALSSFGVKSNNEEHNKQQSIAPITKQPLERPNSGKTATDSGLHSHKRSSKHHQHHHKHISPPPSHHHSSKSAKHHRQYTQILTDDTSTSPEMVQRNKLGHSSTPGPSRPFNAKQVKGSPPPPPPRNPESESQSSKSSTSASSEKSDRAKHSGHRRMSKIPRDSDCSEDRVQALEEYNKELHENLLQTVACIENMETELQCTRAELASFKEKFRRLQESYSVSQQVNSSLEQKLKSVVDSLDSDRKFLMQRTVDLTKQLDSAQKKIGSLENINIPSLIRELLKNHFVSQEALESILHPRTTLDQSDQPPGTFEWPETCSGIRQEAATAFQPRGHEHDPWTMTTEKLVNDRSDSHLSFSFGDDVPDHNASGTKPPVHKFATNPEIHISPPNPYDLNELRFNRQLKEEPPIDLAKEPADISFLSAQRLLNEFLSQIPPPMHDREDKDCSEAATGGRQFSEGNH
ncbi:hypothetical protein DNTS_031267 [Danionella cerebrum]|uniref:Uncharacterized protein n=1 Tax=Danionella cerebrum TaxID=2873325 RepID=A0A553MNI5_9TELE|nr:hypothetical protein DNTS_031267 [Danionella translucida]